MNGFPKGEFSMGRETALVVEDNEMNMKLVRTLLEIDKYRVPEAIDAEAGILLARENGPDLILMGIRQQGGL